MSYAVITLPNGCTSFRTDELNLWISRGLIQLADDQRAEIDAMKRRLDALEAK